MIPADAIRTEAIAKGKNSFNSKAFAAVSASSGSSKFANLLDPEEAEIAAKAFEIKEFLPLAIASVLIASTGIIIAYQAYFAKKIDLSILFAQG